MAYGNWFSRTQREFAPQLLPFAGKPIRYVEIGVWKGDSAHWVLENILTHRRSQGIGIDPYLPDHKRDQAAINLVKEEAVTRLASHPHAKRWRWDFRPSQEVLRDWDSDLIDALYIDGSHMSHDVMLDFCLAWPFLEPGSVVIFDDYNVTIRKRWCGVKNAVAAIDSAFGTQVKFTHLGARQAALVVLKDSDKTWLRRVDDRRVELFEASLKDPELRTDVRGSTKIPW